MKRCSICAHEKHKAIDRAIRLGTPLREIAERYGGSEVGQTTGHPRIISYSAIQRHRQVCLGMRRREVGQELTQPVIEESTRSCVRTVDESPRDDVLYGRLPDGEMPQYEAVPPWIPQTRELADDIQYRAVERFRAAWQIMDHAHRVEQITWLQKELLEMGEVPDYAE